MTYRLLVTGDRNWKAKDRQYIYDILDDFHAHFGISVLIEGDCPTGGVDWFAGHHEPLTPSKWVPEYKQYPGWAYMRGIVGEHYPADWDNKLYRNLASGKSFAGNVRNQQMLDEGKPDHVIAFHRNFNDSRGTKDMVEKARKVGITVDIFP